MRCFCPFGRLCFPRRCGASIYESVGKLLPMEFPQPIWFWQKSVSSPEKNALGEREKEHRLWDVTFVKGTGLQFLGSSDAESGGWTHKQKGAEQGNRRDFKRLGLSVSGELRESDWRLLFPRQEGMTGSSMVTVENVASSNMGLAVRGQSSQVFWGQRISQVRIPYPAKLSISDEARAKTSAGTFTSVLRKPPEHNLSKSKEVNWWRGQKTWDPRNKEFNTKEKWWRI